MPNNRFGYNKETNIFYYGVDGKDFHPKLSLKPVNDNYMFLFYYSGTEYRHQLELPLQKWNNIVFNYVNNGVDVFINGELTLSYTFSNDLPKMDNDDNINDNICVGNTEKDVNINGVYTKGLYGSICNIVYYKAPLKKHDIVLNYNLLVTKNPPILS
jgi:hypothetical protein